MDHLIPGNSAQFSQLSLLKLILLGSVLSYRATVSGEPLERTVEEHTEVTLPCNHGIKQENDINAIIWESRTPDGPIAEHQNGSLRIEQSRFQGRVDITERLGDMVIYNVSRNDRGSYKCVTIQKGVRVENKDWIEIIVNVEPKDVKILCSGQLFGTPNEDCTHFKKDAIKSIKCQAFSNPASRIVWTALPSNCDVRNEGTSEDMGTGYLQWSVLHGVCPGRYCCVANYDNGNIRVIQDCETVGNIPTPNNMEQQDRSTEYEDPSNNDIMLILLIIGSIAGFLLIIVVIFLLIRLRKTQKKKQQRKQSLRESIRSNASLSRQTSYNENKYTGPEPRLETCKVKFSIPASQHQYQTLDNGTDSEDRKEDEDAVDGGEDPFLTDPKLKRNSTIIIYEGKRKERKRPKSILKNTQGASTSTADPGE